SGTYDIRYENNAGTSGTTVLVSPKVNMDNTNPEINNVETDFSAHNTENWTNKDITFTVKVSDPAVNSYSSGVNDVKYSFVGDSDYKQDASAKKLENDIYEFTITAVELSKGGYSGDIYIYAVDSAGNISDKDSSKTVNIKIDIESGTVTIVSVESPDWTNNAVSVKVSVTDITDKVKNSAYSSGIENIKYKKSDDSEWQDVDNDNIIFSDDKKSAEFSFTILAQNYEGTYEVQFTDNAGNVSSTSFPVEMDIAKPVLELYNSDMTEWTNKDVTVTGTAFDNSETPSKYNSGIKAVYYRNAAEAGDWSEADYDSETGKYSFIISEEFYKGDYEIYCEDNAGNTDYKDNITKLFVMIDKISPERTVTYSSPVRAVSSTT
ncbi:MAG: hypothetical protein ACI4RF_02275, partial [Eubacterium sp.]